MQSRINILTIIADSGRSLVLFCLSSLYTYRVASESMTAVEASLLHMPSVSPIFVWAVRSYVDPVPFNGNDHPMHPGTVQVLAVPRSSTYLHIGRVGQHAVTEGLQAFGRQLNGRAVGRAAINSRLQVAALNPAQRCVRPPKHTCLPATTRPSTSPHLCACPPRS